MTYDAKRTPEHGRPDWTIPQDWQAYTPADHDRWDRLLIQQTNLLKDRATPEFLTGLDILRLGRRGIPDFDELSERLYRCTGWSVMAVPGLVPDEVFFEHLANRRFVAGRFIRTEKQFDYLKEPDVFHDVFGHVPLLTDPVFADYMQAYGRGGLRSAGLGAIHYLARLYWYTVEFGLIRNQGDLKIYGAGIVSSRAETFFSLDDPSPNRFGFNMARVMQTQYRIDDFQQDYFIIDSFEDLLRQTLEQDFAPLYLELLTREDIAPAQILETDSIITRGTQDYVHKQSSSDQAR